MIFDDNIPPGVCFFSFFFLLLSLPLSLLFYFIPFRVVVATRILPCLLFSSSSFSSFFFFFFFFFFLSTFFLLFPRPVKMDFHVSAKSHFCSRLNYYVSSGRLCGVRLRLTYTAASKRVYTRTVDYFSLGYKF